MALVHSLPTAGPGALLRRRLWLPLLAVVLFWTASCREADEVRRYQAPRVEHRALALSLPDYQPAKDWKKKERGRSEFARFRETFQAGEAEVSVSVFGGNVGDLLSNINRWRGKVGLDPV